MKCDMLWIKLTKDEAVTTRNIFSAKLYNIKRVNVKKSELLTY